MNVFLQFSWHPGFSSKPHCIWHLVGINFLPSDCCCLKGVWCLAAALQGHESPRKAKRQVKRSKVGKGQAGPQPGSWPLSTEGKSSLWEDSSERNNCVRQSLTSVFLSVCGLSAELQLWGAKNIHCKALIRCLINDIGVCLCPQEKSDATITNIDLERTRLTPTSVPVTFFPLEGTLKVRLSNQRGGKRKMLSVWMDNGGLAQVACRL